MTNSSQSEFGAFDPRFLGASLYYDTADAVEMLVRLIQEGGSADWVRALCKAIRSRTRDRAFHDLAVLTAIPHEARHYHDFLLSPFGNCLIRLRLEAALNAFQLFILLSKGRDILPYPIPAWRALSREEQIALCSDWAAQLQRPSIVPPVFDDQAEHLAQMAEQQYEEIKAFWNSPVTVGAELVRDEDLFEASACLVQLQDCYTACGAWHASLLHDVLIDGKRSTYSTVLKLLKGLYNDAGLPLESTIAGAAITWSLLGSFPGGGLSARPASRFRALFELLRRGALPNHDTSVRDLFDTWTSRLNTAPIRDALNDNAAANHRWALKLRSLRRSAPNAFMAHLIAETDYLLRAPQMVEKAHQYMASAFTKDPQAYVNAYPYLQSPERWVASAFALNFRGDLVVSVPDSALKDMIPHVMQPLDGLARQLGLRRWVFPASRQPDRPIIDTHVALKLADAVTLADLFFLTPNYRNPDAELVRNALRQEGLTLCKVF